MGFGLLIIGDELLSGKRQDRHLAASIELLGARGLNLDWAHMLGDDARRLEIELRATLASEDVVFSFGGIGATPDDRTRQCAARAAGVSLVRHPQAVAEIEAQFGAQAYPHRIRMAEFPERSRIIPNPYNRIPGFSWGDHHFLPGFPRMAWPMMEWVLECYYRDRFAAERIVDRALQVWDVPESELLPILESLTVRFPKVRLSSLPTLDAPRAQIELGVRGDRVTVEEAWPALQEALSAAGHSWQALPVG